MFLLVAGAVFLSGWLPRNGLVGIRLGGIARSPSAWREGHRAAGIFLVVVGAAWLGASLVVQLGAAWTGLLFVAVCLVAALVAVQAARLFG